jgi:transcriptional regulator with XRE-family HTH domain
MDLNKKIGENIYRFRSAKNLTQKEVSESLGMSRTSYNQLENGRSHINVEKLYEIAEVLKISVLDLLPGFERKIDASSVADFDASSIQDVLDKLNTIQSKLSK